MKPKIYTLESVAVDGELGPRTSETKRSTCDSCGVSRPIVPRYSSIEYLFDTWSGSHIISGVKSLFVSSELKDVMLLEKVSEVGFSKIQVTKREYFEIDSAVGIDEMPAFFYVNVLRRDVDCVSKIYDVTICEVCKNKKWELKVDGLDFLIKGVSAKKEKEKLEIVHDSWKGEDIFYCESHNTPIITEKFLSCIKKLNYKDLALGSAIWV